MGVTGLWKLIEPCGKPVPVETLDGKILAVDISIWLHQVVKGFQDNKGSALANAHLLGLFHRLCKLLYYRVRPVFVFDGHVPQLKRDTIARRQQQRSKLNNEAERIQILLLQSLAKEKVVQQALGSNAEMLLKSPVKRSGKATRSENAVDDIFKLPELPDEAFRRGDTNNEETDYENSSSEVCTTTDESSFDESNPRYSYNMNIQAIDVCSQHFRNLPVDVRHEILVDIKETRKQSSWGRLHELPSRGDDFSTFQMKRLLKRRAVQASLEEAEQEMGGRTITYMELKNLFTEEGIVEPSAMEQGSKSICSDENTRFLLVRDLKKKMSTFEEDTKKKDNECPSTSDVSTDIKINMEPIHSSSTDSKDDVKDIEKINKTDLGEEYDMDLDLAIALSLEDSHVYSEKDYQYNGGENLKLNREQSKQLKNAAVGPARAYMIEYGGMNEEEVADIMEKSQAPGYSVFDDSVLEKLVSKANESVNEMNQGEEVIQIDSSQEIKLCVSDTDTDSDMERITQAENGRIPQTSIKENDEIRLHVSDESETDSDLEEVTEISSNTIAENGCQNQTPLEIVVDLTKPTAQDVDLFADVFLDEIGQTNENIKVPLSTEQKIVKHDSESMASKEIRKELESSKETEERMFTILDELKKEYNNVKKINLADIKIRKNSVIEISDEEDTHKNYPTPHKLEEKCEVIEIIEATDESEKKSPLSVKSPKHKTPPKTKVISEYFETNYLIKRTPDKPKEEIVPKVKSPFFINKTPKSNRKRSVDTREDSPATTKKISKATKSLFEKSTSDEVLEGVEPLREPTNPEDVIKEAAQMLKQQKSESQLQELASDLAKERIDLESERNRHDRMGMSISQRMNSDCQELLRLFGIPYIVAPMEAEAQCAFLDDVKLTNGTITDDSDIWLFGGRTVYKNFFAQNKHVLEFRAEQIENTFNCDRKKLIQLAYLVGSDYTTGVHGIGAVTAMEILAMFSPVRDAQSDSENPGNVSTVLSTLKKFRDWWLASKLSTTAPGSSARLALRKKLKNIELHEGFPNLAVVEAYLTPKVDESKDAFMWGSPDVESIREFTKKTFGWTTSKTDDILMPVMKKINEKRTQATITNYFNVKSALSIRQLKVSKRVQTAIDRMAGQIDADTPEKPIKAARTKRTKRKKPTAESEETAIEAELNSNSACQDEDISLETSTSKTIQKGRKKQIRIPNSKESIPQRTQDLEQMRKNKEKAVEVLKKTRKVAKKTNNT